VADVELVTRQVPDDLRPRVRALRHLDGHSSRRFEKILPAQ